MATTNEFLGTQVSLYIGTKKILNATSKDFNLDTAVVDVTDDDTGGFTAHLAGNHTGKMTIEGNLVQQASVTSSYISFEDLMDYQLNRTVFVARMVTGTTGDMVMIANAFVSNTKMGAPTGDKVTFTADLQLTGAITVASIS
jgi:predicted secreted protein